MRVLLTSLTPLRKYSIQFFIMKYALSNMLTQITTIMRPYIFSIIDFRIFCAFSFKGTFTFF